MSHEKMGLPIDRHNNMDESQNNFEWKKDKSGHTA